MSKVFYKSLGKTQTWPDLYQINPSSLTYDDVLLLPQISRIKSRLEIDTKVNFGPYTLTTPIIASPMDTIVDEKMAREMARLGGIAAMPRENIEEKIKICKRLATEEIPCIYTVGLKNGFEDAKALHGNGAKIILVDVAHGGLINSVELAKEIKQKLKVFVITGNIVNFDEAVYYKKMKVDVAKVGIGPGGTCITRLVAGTGFPQLAAIFETVSAGIPVIADGGIKKPGDFAKAIAAGACTIMVGSILAGTDETPGDVVNGQKIARGQASSTYMKDNGVSESKFRAAEGITTKVNVKGPVEDVIEQLMGGLRSAMSYSGAKNISDFQKKAVFVKISRATLNENIPWLENPKVTHI
ncbi:MAG: guanosine monophosphate reductase [Candidatus Levybacteria bacterium]|nr:guanosine monophosphate reductase [Candidatus Levybacteria bacterium]